MSEELKEQLYNMTYYRHIPRFKVFRTSLLSMSLNDLLQLENKLQNNLDVINDKLTIIDMVIRIKENDRETRRKGNNENKI